LAGADESMFNVSASDWKQNPAMIIQKRGDPNIPFCTPQRLQVASNHKT
jgi:hypothetical protein